MLEPVRATDTLANERTYLAYIRTALAFIAFGFVIARFSLFAREFSTLVHSPNPEPGLSTTFGTAMAVFGIVVALLGAWRYARDRSRSARRKGPDALGSDRIRDLALRRRDRRGRRVRANFVSLIRALDDDVQAQVECGRAVR